MNAALRSQFNKVWRAVGAQKDPAPYFDFLEKKYSKKRRYYHNLSHIAACLNEFDKIKGRIAGSSVFEFAIWYHDIIDTRCTDNEKKSAELAVNVCIEAGVPKDTQDRIFGLITATDHKTPPKTENEKLLADIDLSILGADFGVFKEYDENIRKEFDWIDPEQYLENRITVLKKFLSRKTIYNTSNFQRAYGEKAKKNLLFTLSNLEVELSKIKRRGKYRFRKAAVAGTFDRLHDGHKKLLSTAFTIGETVLIGITGDELLKNKKRRDLLWPIDKRISVLTDFLKRKGYENRAEIKVITTYTGGAELLPDLDALVISEEQEVLENASKLNKLRKKNGLKPLYYEIIPMVLKDGKRISSTDLREVESQ